ATPAANYVPYTMENHTLYISGQVPFWNGKLLHIGKVGDDYSIEDAVLAARVCGLNIIAQAKAALAGDLDRVRRIVKVGGFVNCTADFNQHPSVINGASDLFVEVFGNAGKHARFAVGANSLPMGVAVEVDAVIAID
ncbi:MAG: hypothetical protein CFH10_02380, partial [Alphaproteobacteria bacterium MarineAlpha4_Bin2]